MGMTPTSDIIKNAIEASEKENLKACAVRGGIGAAVGGTAGLAAAAILKPAAPAPSTSDTVNAPEQPHAHYLRDAVVGGTVGVLAPVGFTRIGAYKRRKAIESFRNDPEKAREAAPADASSADKYAREVLRPLLSPR